MWTADEIESAEQKKKPDAANTLE